MLLERLGEDGDSPLYACHLAGSGGELPRFSFETPYFLCLIGGDFTKVPPGDLVPLISELLAGGACYFVCWGTGCESAHGLIDDILIGDERFSSEETVIMTTSHTDESIEDALFHLLCAAHPSEAYLDQASAKLALLINQPDAFEVVSLAMMQPEEFVARLTA